MTKGSVSKCWAVLQAASRSCCASNVGDRSLSRTPDTNFLGLDHGDGAPSGLADWCKCCLQELCTTGLIIATKDKNTRRERGKQDQYKFHILQQPDTKTCDVTAVWSHSDLALQNCWDYWERFQVLRKMEAFQQTHPNQQMVQSLCCL